jgi:hypothetical protein
MDVFFNNSQTAKIAHTVERVRMFNAKSPFADLPISLYLVDPVVRCTAALRESNRWGIAPKRQLKKSLV